MLDKINFDKVTTTMSDEELKNLVDVVILGGCKDIRKHSFGRLFRIDNADIRVLAEKMFKVVCEKNSNFVDTFEKEIRTWLSVGVTEIKEGPFTTLKEFDIVDASEKITESVSEEKSKYKPSWEQAPNWANWLVLEHDGSWWWFEKKPRFGWHNLQWEKSSDCKSSTAYFTEQTRLESLEERPESLVQVKIKQVWEREGKLWTVIKVLNGHIDNNVVCEDGQGFSWRGSFYDFSQNFSFVE